MKKIIIVLMLLLTAVVFAPSSSTLYVHASELTTEEIIQEQADYYGVSSVEMYRVAKCESSLLHEKNGVIVKGKAGEIGLFQYMPATFFWFSQMLGKKLDINSKYDQSRLTAFAFSRGLQNHWSCYKMLKKQGVL